MAHNQRPVHLGLSQSNMALNWQRKRCTRGFSCHKNQELLKKTNMTRKGTQMIASPMPHLTVQNVCRWQVWCSKKSSDTTCNEINIKDLREVRAEMLCIGSMVIMVDNLSKAVPVYQRRVYRWGTKSLTKTLTLSRTHKSMVAQQNRIMVNANGRRLSKTKVAREAHKWVKILKWLDKS